MAKKSNKKPFLLVVSGPSGSGKTTICRRLAQEWNCFYSISHTTRPQRTGEINGKDYFFVSKDEFLQMIDQKLFIEWAQVYDQYYGTSKKLIQDELARGKSVIADMDTQGALHVKQTLPASILIFIKPPDVDELQKRLSKRGRDPGHEIEKRLEQAQSEMAFVDHYDHLIVNRDLEIAVQEIKKYIEERNGNS